MGIILRVSCKCGFKEEFLVGAFMANFQAFCAIVVCGPARILFAELSR